MGATPNPLLLSGFNPTGANIGNPLVMLDFADKGANPLLPNIGTSGSKPSTPQNNPFAALTTSTGGAVPGAPTAMDSPAFPANASPYPTSGGAALPPGAAPGGGTATPFGFGNMSQKDWMALWRQLNKTYGVGISDLLVNFLRGGAGFNQQAINNLLASLQPGIERGQENIVEQFSAMGNRFGSPAAVGLGDFESQVNLNEGQLITGMYEQSLQDFISVLMGTGSAAAKTKASSPSFWDQLLSGIKMGGSAAGGLSAGISAASLGADTSILDTIAGAAAGM